VCQADLADILWDVTSPTLSSEAFADLVRSRRTHMLVDRDREVSPETIERLCELATWAPNHKRTWPWRFASLTGEARRRLGEAFYTDMVARDFGDDIKREKTRVKYTRTPNIIVVGCAPNPKATIHEENRDAVAAAIQTLMLGATLEGIATFWSTPALIDSPSALALCGFEPDDRIIGVIYLGYATTTVETPQRPAPHITTLTT
jgi:nitroreductase